MKKILHFIVLIAMLSCKDEKDSSNASPVNEQTYLVLGGDEQYVEITGTSDKDPVLLFIHGGPGWPQTPHLRYFNAELANSMILVAWEQAGCGKSYMNDSTVENLSLEKFISDAHELTQLLKKKFNKDKIYLAGFSWGSVIGLHLAERYPEDYEAYIGISQLINSRRSIELSKEWIKDQAIQKKDTQMLKNIALLEKMDSSLCKDELDCFYKKYELLVQYGGHIYSKEAEEQIKIAETKYEDYKDYDWLKGFLYTNAKLGDALFQTDLNHIKTLKIPAWFLVGRHDWSLPASVTEDFVKNLSAPKKEMVWFENSGHEPLEEEAALFNKEIIRIVTD